MALLTATLSGVVRLSAANQGSAVKAFSALSPLTPGAGGFSVYLMQDYVLGTTTSEFLVSQAVLSNPKMIAMFATQTTRVNFTGQSSSFSAASASVITFKDAFILMDVSGSLPSGIHIGNSASDSSTITVIIAG